ncbi:MAG: hypothetical protein IK020_06525 [Clostridiales bacterium]|nr:hypothetical protein [Clostridiales bacterium]
MEAAGYCVKCGSPYYVNDQFCGHCGNKLGSRKCPLCGGIINCEDLPVDKKVTSEKHFVPSKASPNIPVPRTDPAPLNNKPISDNAGTIENTVSSQPQVDDFKKSIDDGSAAVDHAGQPKILPNEILKPDAILNPNEVLKPSVNNSWDNPKITFPSDSKVPEEQREALIMKVRLKLNPNSVPDLPNEPVIPRNLDKPLLVPEYAGKSPVLPYLKTMTLGQLTANANAGDPHAMFRLGLFYDYLDNEVEIDGVRPAATAKDWYEKAVLAGHGQALFKVCGHRLTLVLLYELTGAFRPSDEEVIATKRDAYEWYSRGLELFRKRAPGTELLNYSEFKKDADRVSYLLAESLYFSQNADTNEVLKLVCNQASIPAQILTALVLEDKREAWIGSRGHEDEAGFEEHNKRIRHLIDLLLNEEYYAASKPFGESGLYAMAAISVAGCFRTNDAAIRFLRRTREGVTVEAVKKIIDDKIEEYSR